MIPLPPTVILNLETLGKCFPSFLEKLKSLFFLVFIAHTVSAKKKPTVWGKLKVMTSCSSLSKSFSSSLTATPLKSSLLISCLDL